MELFCFTDVCGYLVEHFSGMKLDEYFQKNIFEPLGMIDTGFYCPKDKADRLACLYEHNPSDGPKLLDPSEKKQEEQKRELCSPAEEVFFQPCMTIISFVPCFIIKVN